MTNLRYETFGNSGWFDPEEFVVRIPRLGIEATVAAKDAPCWRRSRTPAST